MKSAILVLSGAAFVGALVGLAPSISGILGRDTSYPDTISGCQVTDGDTIRCNGERIRLLGIDAPELPGHCKGNRHCAPGDPFASTDNLSGAMAGALRIERIGEDRYGRTLAMVTGSKGDLSCWQLQNGQAIYKAKWDDGFRVARSCPSSAL